MMMRRASPLVRCPYKGSGVKTAGQNTAGQGLFPRIDPFDWRVLDVSGGHRIYVEQCGNPTGMPVVVLHGGPGGGCGPTMRRFFDPEVYRVVLFDQRGCGRSRPFASVENNTTQDLIGDIETIRKALGIERWILFGGSWGSTLALAYAQAHPERAAYLALRGVFLATQAELDWFYGGGAGRFYPKEWADFVAPIPQEERGDMIAAYHRRLFSGDVESETRFAVPWTAWENRLATLAEVEGSAAPGAYSRAFARLENHYFINGAFLECDGQLLRDIDRIAHIPGRIVQGRFDMICPPHSAWQLAKAWPAVELSLVPCAGHAMLEPPVAQQLVATMNDLRGKRAALDL